MEGVPKSNTVRFFPRERYLTVNSNIKHSNNLKPKEILSPALASFFLPPPKLFPLLFSLLQLFFQPLLLSFERVLPLAFFSPIQFFSSLLRLFVFLQLPSISLLPQLVSFPPPPFSFFPLLCCVLPLLFSFSPLLDVSFPPPSSVLPLF